jgi:hypothetical protein
MRNTYTLNGITAAQFYKTESLYLVEAGTASADNLPDAIILAALAAIESQ